MIKKILTLFVFAFMLNIFVGCENKSQMQSNVEHVNEIYIANWNVENLFDTIDDPDKNDEWFTPSSEIEWTERKLEQKLANLARLIRFMNNEKGPDLLAVQEVEHKHLLDRLVDSFLQDEKYQVAYEESPDNRGIDNALLYNKNIFNLELVEGLKVELNEGRNTRFVLYVKLKLIQNDELLHVFVNHWPSRREGLKESEPRRIKAAETLMEKIESLANIEKENIIILGDFNDLPSNISISKTLKAKPINCENSDLEDFSLYNITYDEFQKGKGTYKYRDHWNMLDQIIISNSLLDNKILDYKCESFEIIMPDFIVEQTGKYKGTPFPTFGGRKYLGGYSDHFPIGARLTIIE